MTTDLVPGMAEAIEERRRSLGMTIGDFAAEAGLTRQGLDPVRRGERRQYNDRTILGVARALRWDHDWYDRILAGQRPRNTMAAVPGDDSWDDLKSSLSEEDRAIIRAMIERLRHKN